MCQASKCQKLYSAMKSPSLASTERGNLIIYDFLLFCVKTLPAIDLVVLLDLPSSSARDAFEATCVEVDRFVPACDNALAAIDFAVLPEDELLRTCDALEAIDPEVFSFFAIVSPMHMDRETTKNRETPSLRLLGTQTTAKWSALRLGVGAPSRRRGIHSAPDSSMVGSMNAGVKKRFRDGSSTDEVSDSCPEARGVMKNERRDRERSGDRFSTWHQASRSSSVASSRGTSCGTNWARSMDSSLTAMAG